ncbi:hypothetical protein Tco_0096587 [Tanacetum coccineum]
MKSHHHREYLLKFTSEYGILEDLHPELHGTEDTIVDFLEGKVGAPKDGMPPADSYSALDITTLNTRHIPFQKQHELLLCLVGLSRRYYLGDDVDGLVQFDQCPKSCQDMDTTGASGSSRTPSTVEKSPLDFADEDLPLPNTEGVGTEEQIQDELPGGRSGHHGDLMNKKRKQMSRKRANDEAEANAPPKGAPTAAKSVSELDPLSYAKPQPYPEQDLAQSSKRTATEIPTEHVATTKVNVQLSVGSPESGKSAFVPSVLRLRFEQEVKLLKKARAKIARRDQRIQVREEDIKKINQEVKSLRATKTEVHGLCNQTKNLETLLEAEADMKKAIEAKNAELTKELESLRIRFSDLQAAFEEFKKYEDARVEQRCAEMDARLDALSIDFNEELYPHMLTAIAGRRWVIGHGILLVVMKCAQSTELRQVFANGVSAGIATGMSEDLKYGIEHGKAGQDLVDVEAYDPEANDKLVKALQDLKDLKYPMVDQLERLKDAPMELIMASIHLEGDTREVAPQRIHPWAVKEDMLLKDVIAANISRAKKKNKCRVVCRTHGIGSSHHARSDNIPVSVPTIAPQGLAILLVDATTQTEVSEGEASPRLLRSKSLPPMYNLDWP